MARGAAADERLGDLVHFDGAHQAGEAAVFFERVLEGEGVYDGGEHAHVIAGGAVDGERFLAGAAEDVAAADHDGDVDAQGVDFFYFAGDAGNGFGVNA